MNNAALGICGLFFFFFKTLIFIVCLTEDAGAAKCGFQPFWKNLNRFALVVNL